MSAALPFPINTEEEEDMSGHQQEIMSDMDTASTSTNIKQPPGIIPNSQSKSTANSAGGAGDATPTPTPIIPSMPHTQASSITYMTLSQVRGPVRARIGCPKGVPLPVRNTNSASFHPHPQHPNANTNSTFTFDRANKTKFSNGAGICLQSHNSPWHYSSRPELYSRKVFIGGLPIDIEQDGLLAAFGQFGSFETDWPRKSPTKAFYPPKGYVFLIFDEECSVNVLMENCYFQNDKYYICVSSATVKNKPAQVRPWRLSDADFVVDPNVALDPRKSVYLTGIPRPIKASELVYTMEKLFNGVCYAGIDVDPGLKYPSGAGRVAFKNRENYIAALSSKYVHLRHADMDKQALVTPYILENQPCNICWLAAPYFCVNVSCLQYYCETCWKKSHARPGFEYHKPTVKEIYEKNRIAKARIWKSTGGIGMHNMRHQHF